MILGNIKLGKMIKEPADLLRLFLAAVFLSAGIFRIFNPAAAEAELIALNLEVSLSGLLVIFEVSAGFLLLLNIKVRPTVYCLLGFLLCAVIYGIIINGPDILKNSWELFVFRLTPTDIFLHVAFIIMLLVVLLSKNKK